MIMRIWSSGYDPSRIEELREFAAERSAPMFRSFEGCLGFAFATTATRWSTLTFWSSGESIEVAEAADVYRSTVADIVAAGFLTGEQSTEIYQVEHWEPPT